MKIQIERLNLDFFIILPYQTYMNQRTGLGQNPISHPYGYDSRTNSNKLTPYLQVNERQLNPNHINFTQQSLIPSYNLPINQHGIITSVQTTQPFFNPNQTLQTIVPIGADTASTGTLFYTDLEKQTRTDLKTFTKDPRQKHICLLICNLIVVAFGILAILIINILDLPVWIAAQMVGIPYLFYFFLSLCNNSLWSYFGKMKSFSHMQNTYQQMQQRTTGHIKLFAYCYHTTGRYRRKVATHTAIEIIPIRECIDISEPLDNFKQNNKYLFCKIKKYFCFSDQNSHNTFVNIFNTFKANNVQDKYQDYSHTLDITIPGFETELTLALEGSGGCLKPAYLFFLLIGLGYPYILMIQCLSQRCSINFIKRVAL